MRQLRLEWLWQRQMALQDRLHRARGRERKMVAAALLLVDSAIDRIALEC